MVLASVFSARLTLLAKEAVCCGATRRAQRACPIVAQRVDGARQKAIIANRLLGSSNIDLNVVGVAVGSRN